MIPLAAIGAGGGAAKDILGALNINTGARKKAQADLVSAKGQAQIDALRALSGSDARIAAAQAAAAQAGAVQSKASSSNTTWIVIAVIVVILVIAFLMLRR